MLKLRDRVAAFELSFASATVAETVTKPAEVGVPETCPAAVRVSPAEPVPVTFPVHV